MMRVGESRRHFRRRDQDVAMSPHPSDPKASYHAPVNVGGQTIDLIQSMFLFIFYSNFFGGGAS